MPSAQLAAITILLALSSTAGAQNAAEGHRFYPPIGDMLPEKPQLDADPAEMVPAKPWLPMEGEEVGAQTPQHARTTPAKVWVDKTCQVSLESDGSGDFAISTTSGNYKNSCRIADWPTNSPTATMICADNTAPTMELDGDKVIFEGVNLLHDGNPKITLYPRENEKVICD